VSHLILFLTSKTKGAVATTVVMAPIEHMGTAGVPGSAGRIIPNTIAKVVKLDGSLAGFDEPGELVVSGPQMALRYANNDQAFVQSYDMHKPP
jgi:4-coumarate--CoA ligase